MQLLLCSNLLHSCNARYETYIIFIYLFACYRAYFVLNCPWMGGKSIIYLHVLQFSIIILNLLP